MAPASPRYDNVAVLIPCFNEAQTVGACVRKFREHLPGAVIYVYDNNSTDGTAEQARAEGAIVRNELLQGKGNVVRRMFADIDADVYILVDGDATYDASASPALVSGVVRENCDMVVARRLAPQAEAYRRGHRAGNWLLTAMLRLIFGDVFKDALSGYRAFSRRFVKSFPGIASGFEIEVELAIHALSLRLPVFEVDVRYAARPEGSASKLSTWRDGFRIMWTILRFFRAERPLGFFGVIAIALAVISLALGIPLVVTFVETGLVPRLPTAVLAASTMTLAVLSLMCGFILDTVSRGRREMKRLMYLSIPRTSGK